MNKGSSQLVFSIVWKIRKMVKDDQFDNGINIFENVHMAMWRKCNQKTTYKCEKIYNDVENGYYDYRDIAVFCLHRLLIGKNVTYFDINRDNIKETLKLYSKERLEKDKHIILSLAKKNKLKGIESFFKIHDDGTAIIQQLIKKGHISPIFFLYVMKKKPLTVDQEYDILTNTEYVKFAKIANEIFKHL